jgi:hypothetical protein
MPSRVMTRGNDPVHRDGQIARAESDCGMESTSILVLSRNRFYRSLSTPPSHCSQRCSVENVLNGL